MFCPTDINIEQDYSPRRLSEMGYPYYGPGWMPQPVCETRKGLGHLLKALYLSLILMLISGLVLGFVGQSMSDFEDIQNEEDLGSLMGTIILLGISGLILLIAGIAAFIMFILGLVEVHRGKAEFGPAHETSARSAIIFLILAILISVISGVVVAAMMFGTMSMTDQGNIFGFQENLTWSGIVSGAIGIVSSIFQYLFMVYLVKELVRPERRGTLWTGFGLGVCSSVVSLIITVMLFNGWIIAGSGNIELAIYTSVIPMVFSLLAIVTFIVCFKEAVARIDSGELRPTPPPPYPGYQVPPPPPIWTQ
jgi:hypothetical protein